LNVQIAQLKNSKDTNFIVSLQ